MARTEAAGRRERTATEKPMPPAIRFIPIEAAPIVIATDLGSVMTLKHGNVFLLSDQFGDVHPDSRGLGLYQDDTRIVSRVELRVNGARPALLQANVAANHRGTIALTNPDLARSPGPEPEPGGGLVRQSLGIERDRTLCGGLRERIRLVNYTTQPEAVEVRLDVASDAADIFEVRGYPRASRGETLPAAAGDDRITFRYVGLDGLERWTHLAFTEPPHTIEPVDDGRTVRVTWRWSLQPAGSREVHWRAWMDAMPAPRRATASTLFPPPPPINLDEGATAYRAWTSGTARVEADHELFNRAVARSLADLRMLVNDGPGPGERYVSAGVPWFATLFGRDAIITALQMLAFRPQIAVETLLVLAARQATAVDAWRDAEPGKILHEWRSSEMVRTGEVPFGPYYGSVDATPLWLILLSETHRWTGDAALVDRLWPNALAALAWIDRWGERDGDGFVEYGRRSAGGLVNQGWKDSTDSIRRRDGGQVEAPIRLVEVQGYVYDARRRMAELARMRGEHDLAASLDTAAESLRQAFENGFWMADAGYYALALDASGNRADALASNQGHALWSGICAPDRARAVADRLLGPELFSGWGVRTYAAGQPGYNPIGYHTGSVWPHDTAIAAAGLKRYGLHDHANRLATAVFEAAQHVADFRLPELFCGFDRDGGSMPVSYPVACSPQAWAAGSLYHLIQTMLGLEAHADRRELEVRAPHLPAWLSRVTLTNIRVGDAAVDLLFHRWRGTTSTEVLRKLGDVSVTIRL